MRSVSRTTFPTLVLTIIVMCLASQPLTVRAANSAPSPDFVDPPPQEPPPSDQQKEFSHTTDIAPQPAAPPAEARRLGYFYKYRHALSAVGSPVADSKATLDDHQVLVRTSVYYLFYDEQLLSYEAGADVLSDGSGAASFARRFIFSREKFRPFTKLGLSVRIEPKDQLGTFLRYEHYRAFGTAGFERLITDPVSFRAQCELGVSFRSIDLGAGLGLVLAW